MIDQLTLYGRKAVIKAGMVKIVQVSKKLGELTCPLNYSNLIDRSVKCRQLNKFSPEV